MYGNPPTKDAPKSERLRYIRRFYVRPLWVPALELVVAVYAIVAVRQTWLIAVFAVAAALWIQGFTSLSLRIRRAERSEMAAHTGNDHR